MPPIGGIIDSQIFRMICKARVQVFRKARNVGFLEEKGVSDAGLRIDAPPSQELHIPLCFISYWRITATFTMALPISSNKSHLAKLVLLLVAQHVNAGPLPRDAAIALPKTIDNCNKASLSDSFLSYSIEFAFFPDFAGKRSAPPQAQS
jgi:hypothetical protein